MITAWIDGGCRGNPGPSAIAFIIDFDGEGYMQRARLIGKATNNEAEYKALLAVLAELGNQEATIYSDSKLLVKQMRGEWKVKAPSLHTLWLTAVPYQNKRYVHIAREKNTKADSLARELLDASRT